MTDYSRPIIATATGGYIDLEEPAPNDIRLTDIAKALSRICRFTGHCSKFYSVAEHSVRVAAYLRRSGYTPMTQLAGLLHDASEAYLGDVSTPLKTIMSQYKDLERGMEIAVSNRFGVVTFGRADIKRADLVLLAYEKHKLLPMEHGEWPILFDIDPLEYESVRSKRTVTKLGWSPDEAEQRFVNVFKRLINDPLMPDHVSALCREAI